MSSMSVHSLINKFSTQDNPISFRHKSSPPEQNYKASSQPSSRASFASSHSLDYNPASLRHYHSYSGPDPMIPDVRSDVRSDARSDARPEVRPEVRPDVRLQDTSTHTSTRPDVRPQDTLAEDLVPEATLLALFGPEMKHIRMSSSTLQAALRLRAEQECTKQEQLRLELAARNFQIIELAAKNDVPPHLIPSMCVGSAPHKAIPGPVPNTPSGPLPNTTPSGPRHRSHSGDSTHASVPSTNSSLHGSPFLSHQNLSRNYDHPDNASVVPPANFRIGTGSARFNQPPPNANLRRPRSPAKIGAAAVASLASPVTPYVPTQRTLPLHQRHFSMPSEALPSARLPDRSQSKTKGSNPPHYNAFHSSSSVPPGEEASGKVSSMQVKPSPAQPLYKQTKGSQVPSQESMTSFQHVIQFHHWKPENPGSDKPDDRRDSGPQPMPSLTPRQAFSHKRHKSNDMSVDLSSDPAIAEFRQMPQPKPEDNEEDISMTSDAPVPEAQPDSYSEARRFSRSSNKGVDIVSTHREPR